MLTEKLLEEERQDNPAYQNGNGKPQQPEMKIVKIRGKEYDIERLWSNQKEILRLVASGIYTPQEVANLCNVAVSTVYRLIKTEMGQQYIEMISGASDQDAVDVTSRVKALADIALSVQEDFLLDSTLEKGLRNKIADKILDRAGHVPVTKNLNVKIGAGLTIDAIEQIKVKANLLRANAKAEAKRVEEAKFEDIKEEAVV